MNDIKQTPCTFNESIVSYMYNELPMVDRDRFEDHLLDCTSCTDEFASVAASRFEVYEWTKEFAEIPTPRFVIPYDEPVTLVEKVRRAFQFNWGWRSVSAAFASAAVILGLGYAALIPETNNLVAVSPETVSETKAPTNVDAAPAASGNVQPTADYPMPTIKAQPIPVKMMRPAAKRTPVVTHQAKFTTNDRRNLNSPRLTEFADDTDDSLRLAELFEDVESSE